VWDAETGTVITTLASAGSVQDALFSPKGDRILTVNSDGTWKLWDAATGNELITLRPDEGSFRPRFSPDGRWLVGINRDGSVCVFDGTPLPEPKK
jgi:WD40 repeat protein